MSGDGPMLSEARDRLDAASGLADGQRRLVSLVLDELGACVRRDVAEHGGDPGYALLHLNVLSDDLCVMLEWIHANVRACFCVEHSLDESSWHVVWRVPGHGGIDSVYGDLSEENVLEVVGDAVRRVSEALREGVGVV